MKAVQLESERLLYEPLSLKHLSKTYVDWLNDSRVNKYLESAGGYTIEALELFLKEQEQKQILFWAILIRSSQKHIGNIKIDPIDLPNKSGEYGIMMGDTSEWGKGYAKEASINIINYCFNELKLSKITLGVLDKNKAAIKLYKNIGFESNAIINNYGVYDGETCNAIRMVKKND
jgi:RimJ/RimL family protein N-acetyltransferase